MIASAVTGAAWFVRTEAQKAKGQDLNREQLDVLNRIADGILSAAATNARPDRLLMAVRSLPSLIALVPPEDQRRVLQNILEAVRNHADQPNEKAADTYHLWLIFAQVSELVARMHRDQEIGHQLRPLVTLTLLQEPRNQYAVARLLVPLIEVAGADENVSKALGDLVGQKSRVSIQSIALWGRHLALYAPEGAGQAALDLLNQIEGWDNSQTVPLGRSSVEPIDPGPLHRIGKKGESRSRSFAREGLARGLAALAKGSGLTQEIRKQAILDAQRALARTGSAEEAAAWSDTIVNLLKGTNPQDAVKILVEVLKYPTAGLTARECNASEPQSATDILLRALVAVAGRDTGTAKVDKDVAVYGPGDHWQVLGGLKLSERFSGIDLEKPPENPDKRHGEGPR
jgi:hypothetical protein